MYGYTNNITEQCNGRNVTVINGIISIRPKIKRVLNMSDGTLGQVPTIQDSVQDTSVILPEISGNSSKSGSDVINAEEMKKKILILETELEIQTRLRHLESAGRSSKEAAKVKMEDFSSKKNDKLYFDGSTTTTDNDVTVQSDEMFHGHKISQDTGIKQIWVDGSATPAASAAPTTTLVPPPSVPAKYADTVLSVPTDLALCSSGMAGLNTDIVGENRKIFDGIFDSMQQRGQWEVQDTRITTGGSYEAWTGEYQLQQLRNYHNYSVDVTRVQDQLQDRRKESQELRNVWSESLELKRAQDELEELRANNISYKIRTPDHSLELIKIREELQELRAAQKKSQEHELQEELRKARDELEREKSQLQEKRLRENQQVVEEQQNILDRIEQRKHEEELSLKLISDLMLGSEVDTEVRTVHTQTKVSGKKMLGMRTEQRLGSETQTEDWGWDKVSSNRRQRKNEFESRETGERERLLEELAVNNKKREEEELVRRQKVERFDRKVNIVTNVTEIQSGHGSVGSLAESSGLDWPRVGKTQVEGRSNRLQEAKELHTARQIRATRQKQKDQALERKLKEPIGGNRNIRKNVPGKIVYVDRRM